MRTQPSDAAKNPDIGANPVTGTPSMRNTRSAVNDAAIRSGSSSHGCGSCPRDTSSRFTADARAPTDPAASAAVGNRDARKPDGAGYRTVPGSAGRSHPRSYSSWISFGDATTAPYRGL